MVHSLRKGLWTIGLLHRTKRRKQNPKEEETEAQSGENRTKMVLPLNDTLNGPKRDEYGALSSQRFLDYPTPSSPKEEETESQRGETEAQSGGNGTKMVLPLNDARNGPKCDEYGALSFHNSLWTIRLFHRT